MNTRTTAETALKLYRDIEAIDKMRQSRVRELLQLGFAAPESAGKAARSGRLPISLRELIDKYECGELPAPTTCTKTGLSYCRSKAPHARCGKCPLRGDATLDDIAAAMATIRS